MMLTVAILAGVINLVGWTIYLTYQLKGLTTSNPVGWLLSSLLVCNSALATVVMTKNLWSGMMYFCGLLPCFAVLCLSCKNGFNPTKQEKLLILMALLGLGLVWTTPQYIIALTVVYYVITYYIFGSSLWCERTSEKSTPWFVWSVAALFQIMLVHESLVAMILPITNLMCWFSIGLIASWPRTAAKTLNHECQTSTRATKK